MPKLKKFICDIFSNFQTMCDHFLCERCRCCFNSLSFIKKSFFLMQKSEWSFQTCSFGLVAALRLPLYKFSSSLTATSRQNSFFIFRTDITILNFCPLSSPILSTATLPTLTRHLFSAKTYTKHSLELHVSSSKERKKAQKFY